MLSPSCPRPLLYFLLSHSNFRIFDPLVGLTKKEEEICDFQVSYIIYHISLAGPLPVTQATDASSGTLPSVSKTPGRGRNGITASPSTKNCRRREKRRKGFWTGP
jgi:hypothetical protein